MSLAKPVGTLLRRLPRGVSAIARGTARHGPAHAAADRPTSRRACSRCREHSDRVVACATGSSDALLANGVPAAKLRVVSPRRTCGTRARRTRTDTAAWTGPCDFRVGYFGRIAYVKGLDVLVSSGASRCHGDRDRAVVYAWPKPEDGTCVPFCRAPARAARPRIMFRGRCRTTRSSERCAVRHRGGAVALARNRTARRDGGAGCRHSGARHRPRRPARVDRAWPHGWLLPFDDVQAWAASSSGLAHPGAARLEWDPASTAVITNAEVARRMCNHANLT